MADRARYLLVALDIAVAAAIAAALALGGALVAGFALFDGQRLPVALIALAIQPLVLLGVLDRRQIIAGATLRPLRVLAFAVALQLACLPLVVLLAPPLAVTACALVCALAPIPLRLLAEPLAPSPMPPAGGSPAVRSGP